MGLLRPGPRGPKVLRRAAPNGTMMCVPEMVTPAMRTTAVLLGFLNLTTNGTMMCRGHGVPEMVTPAMRTTAVLLGFLNLTSDKFKTAPGAKIWRFGTL